MEIEFLKELKKLFDKYDVSIDLDCADCSDLMGIYEETTNINVNGKEIVFQGWGIDRFDISEKIKKFEKVD